MARIKKEEVEELRVKNLELRVKNLELGVKKRKSKGSGVRR